MLKKSYKHLFEQISPSDDLVEKAVSKAKKRGYSRKMRAFKPFIAAAAVFVLIFAAMPVAAANSRSIYELMYFVSPSAAQFFMPICKSCEDNGIKMEVVSAYIHDDTAEICITMQDLTGSRIDDTTDLFDSYNINCPFDNSAHCNFAGYDDETKKATFMIEIQTMNNEKIRNDKITFSVREFISGKKIYDNVSIPVKLTGLDEAQATQQIFPCGGSFNSDTGADLYKSENETALIPREPIGEFNIDGIDMTGIGYIDGKLHIQTAVENSLDNDNHGYLYLVDKDGKRLESSYLFCFVNHYEKQGRIDYCEYVFDVPSDKIADYELYGYFVTSDQKTEGNWMVTFSCK